MGFVLLAGMPFLASVGEEAPSLSGVVVGTHSEEKGRVDRGRIVGGGDQEGALSGM